MHTLRRSRSSASQCPSAPAVLIKKLVVLGDANSGKTSLLHRLNDNEFPCDVIGALDTNDYVKIVDSCQVRLMLVDTNVHYDRLFPLFCVSTDVALVCFPMDSRESLERVASHWKPEVLDKHCQGAPVILVGTKSDLRVENNHSTTMITTREEAMKVAESIGASAYLECSAKLGDGVREVFDAAARLVVERALKDWKVDRRKSKCSIS